MSLPINLTDTLSRVERFSTEFWSARETGERMALLGVSLAVASVLFYLMLIAPALAARERLNTHLPILRQQAAQMQTWSREVAALPPAALGVQPARPFTPLSVMEIEAGLAHNGLHAQNVTLNGDLLKMQLNAASFSATLFWLNEMQKTSRFYVVDAGIVALAQIGRADVTLTLHQAGQE
ncbi:MAG: type II secretion system protein GspM [Gallionella sp.]|nr:type II secretion system protein GspM [Gallionella sp.]